jgi:hypothetical protein
MPNPIRMRRRIGGGGIAVKAAQFVGASSQFMQIADNAALSMGAGVHPTIVFWVLPGIFNTGILVGKCGAVTAAGCEYIARLSATGAINFLVSDGTNLTQATGAVLTLNAWSFIACYYDGVNIGVSVNNGAFATTPYTTDIQDITNAFALGRTSSGSSPATAALNEVGVAKSILSAAELTELYNGGKGKKFGQLSAALAAKFSYYGDLDDAGGSGATWLDKASTNHLTAGTGAAAPTAIVLRR